MAAEACVCVVRIGQADPVLAETSRREGPALTLRPRGIPSIPERFDQVGAGDKAILLYRKDGLLIGAQRLVRRDDRGWRGR
jgi:hypothetical protein